MDDTTVMIKVDFQDMQIIGMMSQRHSQESGQVWSSGNPLSEIDCGYRPVSCIHQVLVVLER